MASLRQQKFRKESGQFIAEGHKLVMELVNSPFRIAGIYATLGWISTNARLISPLEIPLVEISVSEMERISSLSTPSPVLALVYMNPSVDGKGQGRGFKGQGGGPDSLCLALDDIRDPGNLGTIIRIADWFGISVIWCSEDCVELYNPKVVQATMGSIARVQVNYCNLQETLTAFVNDDKGKVYAACLDGESIYDFEPVTRGIILIGNESRGISAELESLVSQKIFIPSYGNSTAGKAESLNASVATAIIVAEFRRKMK